MAIKDHISGGALYGFHLAGDAKHVQFRMRVRAKTGARKHSILARTGLLACAICSSSSFAVRVSVLGWKLSVALALAVSCF